MINVCGKKNADDDVLQSCKLVRIEQEPLCINQNFTKGNF